jgi:hypothetical protein
MRSLHAVCGFAAPRFEPIRNAVLCRMRFVNSLPAQSSMSALISIGLVVLTLFAFGYIVGSELCLPTVRYGLRSGDMQLWRAACRLVAAGEWAIIAVGASFLALVQEILHRFTDMPGDRLVGLCALGLVIGMAVWEISGRTRKRYVSIMSTSLDLVLPASGVQRELYEHLHQQLETGSRAQQQRVLQCLVGAIQPTDNQTVTGGDSLTLCDR